MKNYCEIDLDRALNTRGAKSCGFLNIAEKADCSWVRIPVITVTGSQDGPIMVADSCTHGDEYEGAEAISEFAREIDPQTIKGAFIGIPGLNLEAFSYGRRESHMDYGLLNMNRVYPGNPDTFITARLAAFYVDNIVKRANYLMTFHGGGNVLYVEPQIGYQALTDEVGNTSYKMAKAFGFECLYGMQNAAFSGTLRMEGQKLGVSVITVEIGSQSCRHFERRNHVNQCKAGIRNVMVECGMLEGKVAYLPHYYDTPQLAYIHTPSGGFHHPVKQAKEAVKQGDVLAEIKNLFGDRVGEVIAPFGGFVYGYWDYPVIQPGNWSYLLGRLA